MYAIIKTGGKQYRVKAGDTIDIEKLDQETASHVTFDEVLMLDTGHGIKVGKPVVAGVTVKGELILQHKDRKIVIFKYKKRKNCRRKKGHRQPLSRVKITAIEGV